MTDANVLKVEIENIKKNHDKCEIRSASEHDRLQDQVNEQETKQAATKRGIYNKIETIEQEGKDNLNDAIIKLNSKIDKELIKPFKDAKRIFFRSAITGIGSFIGLLICAIIWLLNYFLPQLLEKIQSINIGG